MSDGARGRCHLRPDLFFSVGFFFEAAVDFFVLELFFLPKMRFQLSEYAALAPVMVFVMGCHLSVRRIA